MTSLNNAKANNTVVKKEKDTAEQSGVFVYIGPSFKGLITGSIFTGKKSDILEKHNNLVEEYPKIARLLVRDVELAESRRKLKEGNNALSNAYKTLFDK